MGKLQKELERQEREKHKYLRLFYTPERIEKEEAYNKLVKELDKTSDENVRNRLINNFIQKYHHREGG